MQILLDQQTVAVTGAANGIGQAIAQAFLDAGSRVIAMDCDEAGLSQFQSQAPDRIEAIKVDVTDYESLCRIAERFQIDHLVCAAARGSGKTGLPFWKLHPHDWQSVLEVTLMGTVNAVHAFAPSILSGDVSHKSVLLLSSVSGQIGLPTDPPYSAAKAALINFAQVAAKDFANDGIRVNVLSPGMVQTNLTLSIYEASEDAADQSFEDWGDAKVKRVAPLGRWQQPDEFGSMAVFLASEHARNITGQTINIDGGQVMHS